MSQEASSIDHANEALYPGQIDAQAAADDGLDSTDRAAPLYLRATLLRAKFRETAQMSYLDEAVNALRSALSVVPQSAPHRPLFLDSLASWLGEKHAAEGSLDVLQQGIAASIEAKETAVAGSPYWALILNNLGLSLGMRYARLGGADDIFEGIRLINESIESTPESDPNLAMYQANLGLLLEHRYNRVRAMSDLVASVQSLKNAVKATPRGDPAYPMRLNNLGMSYGHLYRRTGEVGRFYDAIWATSEAVRLAPSKDPDLPLFLNNLGRLYQDRADNTGNLQAREDAIRHLRAAVATAQSQNPAHPDLAMILNNLAGALKERYRADQLPGSLNAAVASLQEAVAMTPSDHPDRAARLLNLGSLLKKYPRGDDDLRDAVSVLQEALDMNAAPAIYRIRASRKLLACCLRTRDWDRAYKAMSQAVRLVPTLAPKSLQNADKQYLLGQIVGLASDAAAVALKAGRGPVASLELLELGRGIITTSLEDIRSDEAGGLQFIEPELAREFVAARDELNFTSWDSGSSAGSQSRLWQTELARRHDAVQKFDQLLERIRGLPGFKNFLLPTQEDLQAAAQHGPVVVINVSKKLGRCDAFLIEQHQIRTIELPGLRYHDLEINSRAKDLGRAENLEWLWNAVARPVLDTLGFARPPPDGNWSQVWWIPTGRLTRFPIHAAGHYQKGPPYGVLDLVMSSYASSVKGILSRRRLRGLAQGDICHKALLVRMQDTPGQRSLPFAFREVESLKGLVKTMSISFVEPGRRKPEVLSCLPDCTIFHFAGHGHTDEADPLQSYLVLEDWADDRLTVADMLALQLRNKAPFLAYLSACGTGQIKEDALVDENIHLVSAFQSTGFRHVVGTLWEVQDNSCSEISSITYETMRECGLTDASVCLGLHRASRMLRDRWVGEREAARTAPKAAQMLQAPLLEGQTEEEETARDGKLLVGTGGKGKEGGENDGGLSRADREMFWTPYIHFGV